MADADLPAPYAAPGWLPGGNLQTLYTSLCVRVPRMNYRRERIELADGDFLDFDWTPGVASPAATPTAARRRPRRSRSSRCPRTT